VKKIGTGAFANRSAENRFAGCPYLARLSTDAPQDILDEIAALDADSGMIKPSNRRSSALTVSDRTAHLPTGWAFPGVGPCVRSSMVANTLWG
jgi:hypothetical protein